jgi:hypothetical protein
MKEKNKMRIKVERFFVIAAFLLFFDFYSTDERVLAQDGGTTFGVNCGECDGKVTDLTLQYNGVIVDADIKVVQKKDDDIVFTGTVQPGETFTFSGADKNGTLSTEIRIYVNDDLNTSIHTSCSEPIGPGLVRGDFEVVEGYSLNGGFLCAANDDDDSGGGGKKPKKHWRTDGNANIDPNQHFLGTTDPADLVIKTDNNEQMRIKSTGEVGIGVADPQGKLDVGDRTDPDPVSGICPPGYLFIDYNENLAIDSGECWRGIILKDGKIGIGTTTPSDALTVDGNITPTEDDTYSLGAPDKVWKDVYVGADSLHLGDKALANEDGDLTWGGEPLDGGNYSLSTPDGTIQNVIVINNSGNVGIGTEDPSEKLTIDSGDNVDTKILFSEDDEPGASIFYEGSLPLPEDKSIHIRSEIPGSEQNIMTWKLNGNVGIGTDDPGERLSVDGIIESTIGGFKFPDGSIQTEAGGASSSLGSPDGSQTNVLVVDNNGNIGIGTSSPTAELEVNGTVAASGFSSTTPFIIYAPLGTERMRVDDLTGNVGIGTPDPVGDLHVHTPGAGIIPHWSGRDNIIVEGAGTTGISILTGNGSAASLVFGSPADSNHAYIETRQSSGKMAIKAGGIVTMTLDNGKVGIGTPSPAAKLEVNGDVIAKGITSNRALSFTTSAANNQINLQGVGFPRNASISWSFQGTGGLAAIYGRETDATVGLQDTALDFVTAVDGAINTQMRIDGSGNVGIGTTSPGSKLHIASAPSEPDAAITLEMTGRPANNKLWVIRTQGPNNDFGIGPINDAYTTGTFGMRILREPPYGVKSVLFENGNVGIGVPSTAYKLDVSGTSQTIGRYNRSGTDGGLIDFHKSDSWVGGISVSGGTVSYNAFTGSHYGWTSEVIERGMLVSLTGINRNLHDNPDAEIIYGVVKSTTANDPKILGSYLSLQEPGNPTSHQNPHLITAVGNGGMWVADTGENIEIGDYLISSHVPGHAMKDQGDYDISYIVARAAEPVDWANVSETINGTKHKKISVFFESLVRNHASDKAIAELKIENETFKKESEQLREKLTALADRQEALEDMFLALSTDLPKERLAMLGDTTTSAK